jgi:hypothetical protein
MRHLGLVRALVTKQVVAKALLTEMVLRVCKNLIRRQMRKRMLELQIPCDGPFINVALTFMNLIGTCALVMRYLLNAKWHAVGAEDVEASLHFWETIKKSVVKKFKSVALHHEEEDADYCLRDGTFTDVVSSSL